MNNQFLSYEEQNNLVKASIMGDQEATMQLVDLGYHLIRTLARPYAKTSIDFEDLVQEGIYGLLEAIPRYRPDKGTKFITYAYSWIKKRILMFANESHIHVPEMKLQHMKAYHKLLQFNEMNQIAMTDEEMRIQLGFSEEEFLSIKSIPKAHLDFETELLERGSSNGSMEDPILLRYFIEEALQTLKEEERFVITKRFGFYSDGVPLTHKVIGEQLGCSKEWVRQLEKSGISKLRNYILTAENY